MARITEKIKIYIYKHVDTGVRSYCTHTVELEYCPWLTLVGTVDAVIEYDEADLVDLHTTQLKKAEQELEAHRTESAVKERQLLDRVESLRALPHLEAQP